MSKSNDKIECLKKTHSSDIYFNDLNGKYTAALTDYYPVFPIYTPWKHSGGIKREHQVVIGYKNLKGSLYGMDWFTFDDSSTKYAISL